MTKHWTKILACVAWAVASSSVRAGTPLDQQTDVATSGAPQTVILVEHDFDKGESSGLHIHHGIEMAYVLKGTMRISITGHVPFVVNPGDSFRVEREVPHEAVNIGDASSALIITYVVDKGRPVKEAYPPKP